MVVVFSTSIPLRNNDNTKNEKEKFKKESNGKSYLSKMNLIFKFFFALVGVL